MPPDERRAHLRRRTVLSAAVAAAAAFGLTGCDIRLKKGAPHVPGIKTQSPPPDQPVLRQLLLQLDMAAHLQAKGKPALSQSLTRMHRAQRTRLIAVMATQGMTPAPQPTSAASPAPLGLFEAGAAQGVGTLASLTARNLPMAAAIGVTFGAAAQMLGTAQPTPNPTVPKPAETTAILPALQAAIYAFEVIVAKTPVTARARAKATLTALSPTRSAWEAALGTNAPGQPDGYALPVQPTTDAVRRQLAQQVLTDLADACAGQIAATRGDAGSFLAVVHLWTDATAQLWRWGATPSAFPGLAD
ncbi:DUF4439 domain-containing protein [Flexivirga caeni]|uniref:DUF4439 domain-containing protein n=1 Tax=Flexivirga caeni TaxID=2294115 RepID=A0A3M9MCV3_9MICO|nr:DUF4439 domain-containing protein [Flexivirga caeni]RNI23035.1 DUF4439 domain-containing protein [Flexivirga caeni]